MDKPLKNPTSALNELIEVLNDGIAFFELAAQRAEQPSLVQLFQRFAQLKGRIAADLRAEVALGGEDPPESGSWLASLRQSYADLRSRLSEEPELAFIDALEEQEDRILHVFQQAARPDQPMRVRELAARYLPEIEQMHDDLRDLKRAVGD